MKGGHFKGCNPEFCHCESKRYWIIFGIGCGIFVAEIIGGIVSGSLALLSDAFHVLIDSAANIVSIVVAYLVLKRGISEPKCRAAGGYINAALLLVIGGLVLYEAIGRLIHPPKIISWLMISVAVFGAIGNFIQNRILEKATAAEEHHVTHEAMHLHVVSDLWQSVAVVVGGILIALTGFTVIDPVLSILISFMMFRWSIRLFRRSRAEHKTHHPD